jgi:hypothetical protein
MKKLMTVVFLAAIPCCWAQIPGTNIAVVDGITNTNIAAAVNYFANKSEQGGVVWDYIAYEDVLTNPFQQDTAIKLFLGTGKPSNLCGSSATTNVNCLVLEAPWVLPAGTQIHGSGRVNFLGDPSTGTMFTIGKNFPAPLGPSSRPSPMCNASGGSLSGAASPGGNFYFVVAQYNSVDTNSNGQLTPGIGLHSSEFSCNLATGSSGSVSIPTPSALNNSTSTFANGLATEWYTFGTSGFSGTATFSTSSAGGCTVVGIVGACATASSMSFAQGQPFDLAAGVPICVGSNTFPCPATNLFYIASINNGRTVSILGNVSANQIAIGTGTQTWYSSLGAYQMIIPGSQEFTGVTATYAAGVVTLSVSPATWSGGYMGSASIIVNGCSHAGNNGIFSMTGGGSGGATLTYADASGGNATGCFVALASGANGICAGTGGSTGSIDPQGCLQVSGSGTMIVTTLTATDGGYPPLPVDVSNCMFYMGGGNSSNIIFDTFIENFSINLTNGDSSNVVASSATQPTPYTNSPACAFYVNTAQEESYLHEFNISGASQQSYGVFANSAPNFSMEDAITGGGPDGYEGFIDCTAATPSVCTLHGSGTVSNPVGNWWGVAVRIATASTCPLGSGALCIISTVNSPTQFTLTTPVAGGAAISDEAFCIGSNQPSTNCGGSGTKNGGNFIPYIFDGSANPDVSATGANGTARLMKNVSISSKAGAYNPYLVDIRGPNASVLIAATHMEENPATGNDCVYITGGANVTFKGDKSQCPNATVHRDATAGQGSVENILNSAGALFEDDQITAGSGNGCGNNCLLKNPGGSVPGSYASYVNYSTAAAPIFAAWGFPKAGTPTAGKLQCVFGSASIGDCATAPTNFEAIGIGLTADNSTAQYQFAGVALVNSSTPMTWSQKDTVCSDPTSAAFAVDVGLTSICPPGTLQIGFVYATDASTTSHLVALQIGKGTGIMVANIAILISAASIGNTNLCGVTPCPVGTYRVNAYVDITTACTTGGAGSTYAVNVSYTDDGGSKNAPLNLLGTGVTGGAVSMLSTANFGEATQTLRSAGTAAIQYNTTSGGCGTGVMVGNLYLSLDRVQ